ncbi:hypothetical protein ACLB6M_18720 [Enterobacter hormaechei]
MPNAIRSAVTPGAPISGNSDFASDAPLCMDIIAISMTATGIQTDDLRGKPWHPFSCQFLSKEVKVAV